MGISDLTPAVGQLVARSNRLGSDPKVTNYAGGNTSAKGEIIDPVSGEKASLTFVKGSGGDLGTLKESGLAILYTDKIHSLKKVYPGVDREDEMVALFDYCLYGKGGAAPSIDTSMHGLVEYDHVDHLHPDSIIAFGIAVAAMPSTSLLSNAAAVPLNKDCISSRTEFCCAHTHGWAAPTANKTVKNITMYLRTTHLPIFLILIFPSKTIKQSLRGLLPFKSWRQVLIRGLRQSGFLM